MAVVSKRYTICLAGLMGAIFGAAVSPLLQTKGKLNDVNGIYEYFFNDIGQVTHQRFIPSGNYTGFPNQKAPKRGI